MTTSRTHEQLTEDLRALKQFITDNLAELQRRGILDSLISITSRAEAKLDAHVLFPLNPGDRLGDVYRLITRAWIRINAQATAGEEVASTDS